MVVVLSAENIPEDVWQHICLIARAEFKDHNGVFYWFESKYSAKLLPVPDGSYVEFEFPSKEEYARFALTWL